MLELHIYLDLALSLEIEHGHRGYLSHTVRGGTGSEEEVTVRVDDTLVLEASPAGWVVGYGAVLRAREQHMTFILWIHKNTILTNLAKKLQRVYIYILYMVILKIYVKYK